MTMRLNGWNRLFILASVIWIAVSTYFSIYAYQVRRNDSVVILAIDEVKRNVPKERYDEYIAAIGGIPTGQFGGTLDVLFRAANARLIESRQVNELATNVETQYGHSDERTQNIEVAVKVGLMSALIVPAIVYVAGLVIAWVVRGFRRP